MDIRTVRLIDKARNVLAVARIADEGEHYGGTIELTDAPAYLRALFEEFEGIVNGQMFSLLDAVEERIDSLAIKAAFDNGCEVPVHALQVFPSTGGISFRLAEASVPRAKGA